MAAPEDGMKTIEAKVVVLGSQGVGKTSLVIRYVGGMFSKAVSPTIGASFFTYKMTVDNYRVKLQVWDTAGQERFRSMTGQHIPWSLMNQLWTTGWNRKYMAPMYYRKANAAMLMYDITSSDTFYDVKDWVKELKKNVDSPIIMCLLGNKSDLESGRQVMTVDAEEFAQSIEALFYETSALKNTGIEESFLQVAKQLVKMYETQPNCGLNNSSPQESQDIFSTGDNLKLPETTEHTAKQSDNCGC